MGSLSLLLDMTTGKYNLRTFSLFIMPQHKLIALLKNTSQTHISWKSVLVSHFFQRSPGSVMSRYIPHAPTIESQCGACFGADETSVAACTAVPGEVQLWHAQSGATLVTMLCHPGNKIM